MQFPPRLSKQANCAVVVIINIGPTQEGGREPLFTGCSKTSRYKAPELSRSEAYTAVRRNDERGGQRHRWAFFSSRSVPEADPDIPRCLNDIGVQSNLFGFTDHLL